MRPLHLLRRGILRSAPYLEHRSIPLLNRMIDARAETLVAEFRRRFFLRTLRRVRSPIFNSSSRSSARNLNGLNSLTHFAPHSPGGSPWLPGVNRAHDVQNHWPEPDHQHKQAGYDDSTGRAPATDRRRRTLMQLLNLQIVHDVFHTAHAASDRSGLVFRSSVLDDSRQLNGTPRGLDADS